MKPWLVVNCKWINYVLDILESPSTMGPHLDRARPSELRMDSHLGAMVDESCVSGTGLARDKTRPKLGMVLTRFTRSAKNVRHAKIHSKNAMFYFRSS